ncbi:Hypothetical_protein [Hexamita inflata]|uniref:Hypothetical_protein n=1 Tax=Hexamita inflata TaxID=28002 RepID=A0AA86UDG7_9EUKA|nr:Hypothetical protein HINF_LOCUS35296 [Hexamita inflata]
MQLNKVSIPLLQLYTIPDDYDDSEIIKSMHELADFDNKQQIQLLFTEYFKARKNMRDGTLESAIKFYQSLNPIIEIITDVEKEYIFVIPWKYGYDDVLLHSLTEEYILAAMNVAALSNSTELRLSYYNMAIMAVEKVKSDMKPVDDLGFLYEYTKAVYSENQLIDDIIQQYDLNAEFSLGTPNSANFSAFFKSQLSQYCEIADTVGKFYKKAMKYKECITEYLSPLFKLTVQKFYFYRRFPSFLLVIDVYKQQPTVAVHTLDEIERYYQSHNLELDLFYQNAKIMFSNLLQESQNLYKITNEKIKQFKIDSINTQDIKVLQKGFDYLVGNLLIFFNKFTNSKRFEQGQMIMRINNQIQKINAACSLTIQFDFNSNQIEKAQSYQILIDQQINRAQIICDSFELLQIGFLKSRKAFRYQQDQLNAQKALQILYKMKIHENTQLLLKTVLKQIQNKDKIYKLFKKQNQCKITENQRNNEYIQERMAELNKYSCQFKSDEDLKTYILTNKIQVSSDLPISDNFEVLKSFVENNVESHQNLLEKAVQLEYFFDDVAEQNTELFHDYFGMYEFQINDLLANIEIMTQCILNQNSQLDKLEVQLLEGQNILQQIQ